MLSHKKYMEIQNLNPEIGDMFEPGDQIIIQEKIDGSNASFQYDRETDSVICFSRNQILSPELHLRGFYEWVQKLDKERVHAVLGDNLRMFGEWLVRHTVPYPKDCYETLYCSLRDRLPRGKTISHWWEKQNWAVRSVKESSSRI